MLTQSQEKLLASALHERSITCERGIVALRGDGQAGIGIVAPNSLMLATSWFDGDLITDFHLN